MRRRIRKSQKATTSHSNHKHHMNTSKTCKHCLGKGQIVINAGTGLLAACVKCALPKPAAEIATAATKLTQ